MTEKLYETDSFLRRFTATVTGCTQDGDHWRVTLDRTAFFPEGGGQPADRGALSGAKVLDVQLSQGEVVHTTDAPLEVGAAVEGEIDWARRFDLMQQHTADHLFSGLVHRQLGLENIGFHIGEELVHMDFGAEITPVEIDRLEREANRLIAENRPIRVLFPDDAALAAMDLRSKKELDALEGAVRVVEIEGADLCACCGTHVAATGQLGLLKITGCQSYKGGVRVFMAAGERAVRLVQREHRQVEAISGLLSAKQPEIVAAVTRLKNDAAAAHLELGQLRGEMIAAKAAGYAGRPHPVVFERGLAPDDLRRFALALCERGAALAAVFSGGEGNYKYALASDGSVDARALGREMNTLLAGRGGGKPELVQGSLAAEQAQIEVFFAERGLAE